MANNIGMCLDLSNKDINEWVESVGLEETYRQLIEHNYNLPTLSEYQKLTNLPLLNIKQVRELYDSLFTTNEEQFKDLEELKNKTTDTQAAFWNNMFYFDKQIELRQAYEEAFHKIFQTLTTTDERNDLLKLGRELLKNRLKNQGVSYKEHLKQQESNTGLKGDVLEQYLIEEEIAKEYVNFATYGTMIANPIRENVQLFRVEVLDNLINSLLQFFKKLFNIQKGYRDNKEVLDSYFNRIQQGKFKDVQVAQENGYSIPSYSPLFIQKEDNVIVYSVVEQRKHYNTIVNIVRQLRDIQPYNEDGSVFTTDQMIEQAIDIFSSVYKNSTNENTQALVESLQPVENPDFMFDETVPEIEDSLNYRNLVKDIQEQVERTKLTQLDEFEYNENEEDNSGGNFYENSSDNADKRDYYKSFPEMMKIYLSTIPVEVEKTVQRTFYTEKGNKVKNKIKVQHLVDPLKVFSSTVKITANQNNTLDRLKKMILFSQDSNNKEFNAFLNKFLFDVFLVDEQLNNRSHLSDLKDHILSLTEEEQLQTSDSFNIQNVTLYQTLNKAFNLFTRNYRMYFIDSADKGIVVQMNPATTNSVAIQLSSWQIEWEKNKQSLYDKNKSIFKDDIGSQFAEKYNKIEDLDKKEKLLDKHHSLLTRFFTSLGVTLSPNYIKYIIGDYIEKSGGYLPYSYRSIKDSQVLSQEEIFDIGNIGGLVEEIIKQNSTYKEDPSTMFDPFYEDRTTITNEGMLGRLRTAARGNVYFDENAVLSSFLDSDNKMRYGHQHETILLNFGVNILKDKNRYEDYKNSLGNFKSNPLIDFYDSLSVDEKQMLTVFSSLGITKQPISESGTLLPSSFKRSTVNEVEPNLFITNNINIALKGYRSKDGKKMIPYHVSTLEASNTNSYFTGTWWGKREEFVFEDPQKGKQRRLSENTIVKEDGSLGQEGLDLIKPLVEQEYTRIQEVREFLLPYLEEKKPELTTDSNGDSYLKYNITEKDLRSVSGYTLKNIINGFHTGVLYLNEDMTLHHKTITDSKAVRGVVFSQSLKGIVNNELSNLYYEKLKGVENESQIDDMIKFNVTSLLNKHVQSIDVDMVNIDKNFYIPATEKSQQTFQKDLGLYTFEDVYLNLYLNSKLFFFNDMLNKISFNRLLFGDFAIQNKNDLDDYSKRIKALESNIISGAYRIVDKSKGVNKPFTSVKSVMMVEAKSMKDDLSSVQVDENGNPVAIDSDDAQSYSSVEHFRKLQWGLGRLTTRTVGILNKIQEGITLSTQEKKELKGTEFFNIQKTRGYGKELDLKTSEFYLTKPFVALKRRITQEQYDLNGVDYYSSENIRKPEGISSFTIPKEGATRLVTKEETSEGTFYYEWVDDGTRTYLYDKMMLLEGFRRVDGNWVYQGEKAKIDVISPISAHKRKKQNVWDGDVSTFTDSIHNQEFDIENDNLYGLQVENPSGKNEVIDPTQEAEIILSEVSGDIEFFSFDGKSKGVLNKEDLYKTYEELSAKRVNNSWNVAIKEVVDQEGNPLYKYFWKMVQEGLQDTGGDLQSINFLNLLETNDGVESKYTPEYNANIPIVKNKVEQMIFSYFSKGVLKQKRAGESKAMFSPRGIGFLKKLETHVINGETIYTWTAIDRNSEEYKQGIVLAQNNNFVRKGYTFNGLEQNPVLNTLIPLLEDMSDREDVYFIDEARHLKPRVQNGRITGYYSEAMMPAYRPDMKSIQDSFRYMSGVRIPSQDKGTSANIEWIEMMDYVYGNSVSIAKEIQELAGSDFDIDKLFVSYPEGYWERDVFIPYEKIDNMSVMFDWYKQYLFNKPKSLFKRRLTEELKANKVYNELKNEVVGVKPQLDDLWNYYNDLISDVYYNRQITLEDRNLLQDEISYLKDETDLLGQDYNDYRNLTDQFIEMGDKVSSLNKTLRGLRNEKTQIEEKIAQLSIDLKSLRSLAEEKVLNDLNLPATVDEYSKDIYANTGLVNNELLQIKQATLTHNYKTYSRPTDVGKLKDLDGSTYNTFSRSTFTDMENVSPFTSLYQKNYRKKIQASKTGIASAVNANLTGTALTRLGVVFNDSNVIRIKDLNGVVHTYDRFTETTVVPDGSQEVLSWMSSLITATTDEAKEGVLAYFKLYEQGLDVFATGLLYGIHPDILVSIINNPTIQSAIERSQRDPLSFEKVETLSSILLSQRLPLEEKQEMDLSNPSTQEQVEVFSRILETAEQNADFVKFMRLKRGYDATYSDFTKILQAGLRLGLDKVIPFYNTPLIQEFKETEHKAYNLPYYLEKGSYAVGNTFNYMSKIIPDTYNVLGKFLIEGTTNYNLIYNHLTKVANIPAYKVEDFRKEVFVSILGRMLQASKQYNLDLNLIVDTGDNKTLGKRYLDIVEKYKDDVDISESPLFKKLLPNLAVTKRKQKEIAKEKKYIVDSDFTDTFSLKVFSKVDTDMQQDLMDEYFRLSKHPDEDVRSFLKDLFSYYILKDAMFFSPSGISKIFPNNLFKGISDSLDKFMENPIQRFDENLRRIEQNILLDVRNQDFIKTIPAVIEVEKTNEKGDVVSDEVNTYYINGGLLSLIRGNKTTHIEQELYKKGIISQDGNGKYLYPEVIAKQAGKEKQFYKKVNEGMLTVDYVLTPLFGTQNTYSSIAQKTVIGSSQNLEGIISSLEEGKESVISRPKLPDFVKESLIKIIDDQITNLSTFRNQNTSEVVINEVTKDNLSMSVEEVSSTVVGEEISSYSDNLAFALTNPTHTSPTGKEWQRNWTKGQLQWRQYLSKGIVFNNVQYKDVEEAYQKNKSKYVSKPDLFNQGKLTTDDLMVELLTIKLQTYPRLVEGIDIKGGLQYLQNSTHQPTKQNSHWETGGDNGFINALVKSYNNVKNISSEQNNTQTISSLERIVTKYPKTVTMVEGGIMYPTSKLLEIVSVFKNVDDGTIADRREFSEEILSEYGMTNKEYTYAKNNQGVLSSLLIEAENLNLGYTTFPDIVNYILNQNVEYVDTYQLNLFDQNNTYSEDEVNNKPC